MADLSSESGAASPAAAHREQAPESVRCAVLTISDTRTHETDLSGAAIIDRLTAAGHPVLHYQIAPDEPARIAAILEGWLLDPAVEAVLTNGGTGIAARDTTYDVVAGLLDKRIDGFGELFRMLSYAEIGAAAMLSRATAGLAQGRVVIAMPGSTNAVTLAMERLVIPELRHLRYEATK